MKILTATPLEAAQLTGDGSLNPQTAEQAKVLQKKLDTRATLGDIVALVPSLAVNAIKPHLDNLGDALQALSVSHLSLLKVLVDKELITDAELQKAERELRAAFQAAGAKTRAEDEAKRETADDAALATPDTPLILTA